MGCSMQSELNDWRLEVVEAAQTYCHGIMVVVTGVLVKNFSVGLEKETDLREL